MNLPANAFHGAALYAMNSNGAPPLLLQVFSDFDVARLTLDASPLGKSCKYFGVLHKAPSPAMENARSWTISSQKHFDYAFENFFQAYKPPHEVKNKPLLDQLLLMPLPFDRPLLPNDLGDQ